MPKPFTKNIASVIFVAWLLTLIPSADGTGERSILHLAYTSELAVKKDVFIAPEAFKVSNDSGMLLLAKAPKWEACIYNAKTKKMSRIPFAKWQKIGIGIIESELDPPKADQRVDDAQKILGLEAVHYRSTDTVSDDFYQMRGAPRNCVIDYYGTKALALTDNQRRLFAFWFGLPLTKELPLAWLRTYSKNEKRFVVKILTWNREPYDEHIFAEPANYTLANNTREVYLGNSTPTINSMFELSIPGHKVK
jgi:hypothetical protein